MKENDRLKMKIEMLADERKRISEDIDKLIKRLNMLLESRRKE